MRACRSRLFISCEKSAPGGSRCGSVAVAISRITVSTVLISGHAGPDTMIWMADQGKGRYYNVTSPNDLPPARREKYKQSGRKSKVLVAFQFRFHPGMVKIKELTTEVERLAQDLQELVKDIKRDPRKYFKFSVF